MFKKKTLAAEGRDSTPKAAKADQAQLITNWSQVSLLEADFVYFVAVQLECKHVVTQQHKEDPLTTAAHVGTGVFKKKTLAAEGLASTPKAATAYRAQLRS